MDEASASNNLGGTIANTLRGLLGAALGGAAGYFITGWVLRQGFYALALPGACLGLGAGLLVRKRCQGLAIVCGLLALALGLFTDWMYFRWPDPSLGYFLRHLGDLPPLKLILIGLGTLGGYWFALGVGGKRPAPSIKPRDS